MIKKIAINFFVIILLFLIISVGLLSSYGIETARFNKLISNQIEQTKNINVNFNTIKFKIDLNNLSLFLETIEPKITYKNLSIPVQKIKVYIDIFNFNNAEFKIKKISLSLNEIEIDDLKRLSKFFKPSNFNSFLNNKITQGKFLFQIDFFFNNKNQLSSYILKGSAKKLKANIMNDLNFSKTKFNFFADKDDILIQNFFGKFDNIKINEGDIRINLENGIKVNSNFETNINLDGKNINNFKKLLNKIDFAKKIKLLEGNFKNNFSINFDNTYKVENYSFNTFGKINKSIIDLPFNKKNNFIDEEIKEIFILNTQFESKLSKKKFEFKGNGKYSLNNKDYLNFNLENNFQDNNLILKSSFDYKNSLNFDLINFKKTKNSIASISLDLEKRKNLININKLNYNEKNNFFELTGFKISDNKFQALKKLEVKTANNDFFIQFNKKILIKGSKFDASNLPNFLSNNKDSYFNKLNNRIEIDFKNVKAPLSEKLQNFRLIGELKKGKFVKISSKGDFGGNNYLDISLKKDSGSEKKFLEIYSDLTRPLLTEYSFFKGLTGGKLFFSSLIDGSKSNSKLKIENFKVVNAPGVIRLLSLADLGGLADLVEGEGLSFDVLEIDMEKDEKLLKLNEILALGPSMSVLIEGYQDSTGLTSLKGTLVPAKTLNKMISKIPVIGNIVIPKEVGEGLFGISFKMKGPKGNIKTTINPIRTLTPRFIQKIIDKNRASK